MKQTLDASSCTSDGSCQLDLLRLHGLDIFLAFMIDKMQRATKLSYGVPSLKLT